MNILIFAVLALLVAMAAAAISPVYSGGSNSATNSAEIAHGRVGRPPKGGHAPRPFVLKHPGHDGMPHGTHGGFIPGTYGGFIPGSYGGYGQFPYGYGYPMGGGLGPLEYAAHGFEHGHAHGHGPFGGYGAGMPLAHHGHLGV